jgi:hypothetical protein
MRLLRRVLYLQAAVYALAGAALAALPRFVVTTMFGQVHYPEYAWVRVAGLEALGLAMFMVLVAQRAPEVWWWSWAFVLPTALITVVAVANALVGLPESSSGVLWWILAGVNASFAAGLIWGLARTGQERPLP